jgi:cytochrome c oxidase cbb3-type subunit 3
MQKAEDDLNEVRANYLKRVQQDSAAELLDDQGIKEFIFRAGKVRFEDNCAGCHGHNGAGGVNASEIASALNDKIWMHGGDVHAIELSIHNMAVHPFGIVHRLDRTSAKVLAIYVHGLLR